LIEVEGVLRATLFPEMPKPSKRDPNERIDRDYGVPERDIYG